MELFIRLYKFFTSFVGHFMCSDFEQVPDAEIAEVPTHRVWESVMQDILWIAVTIAFFAVAIAYVHFCERVK